MVFLVFLGVLGLVVGSFLGALTWRFPRGRTLLGRSSCPRCGKTIAWYDNIPVISYILLRGHCRHCGKKISLRYPAVELVTALLFVLVGSVNLGGWEGVSVIRDYQGWLGLVAFPYFLFLVSILVAIFVIDLEHKLIPDELLYPSILISLLVLLPSPSPTLVSHFSWAVFLATFLYLVHLATRGRGMGLGDVKLAFLLGLVAGYPASLVAIFLAFLTGAAVGLILVLTRHAKFGKPIPFGPFLVAGLLISLFASNTLLTWYLK